MKMKNNNILIYYINLPKIMFVLKTKKKYYYL